MQSRQNLLKCNKFYVFVFIGIIAIMFCLWLIGFTQDYQGEQANVFFLKTADYNADFNNVAKYSSSPNPYIADPSALAERGYMPLSYVIMRLFSNMADYQNLSAAEAGFSTTSLVMSSFAAFFMCAILFLQLYEQKTGAKGIKFGVAVTIVLSGAFMRAFERGNLIMLALVCVLFFIMNYNSKNKAVKELALIALAVSAALKGYPAVLGILLLYEKRWKEAARLVAYGIMLVFIPFLFIEDGFYNIPDLIRNMAANSEFYSQLNEGWRFGLRYLLFAFLDAESGKSVYDIMKIITYVFFILSLIAAPFMKTQWKKYALLLLPVILLPDNSGGYCILYTLPFFIMFLNQEQHDKRDIVFLVLFILIFNPYQIPFLSGYVPNACVSVIWIWLLGEGIFQTVKHIKHTRLVRKDSAGALKVAQ